jgi:hypothetical protein
VGQGVVANAAGDIAISTDRPGLGVVEGSDIRRYDFRALGIDEITMVSPALRGFLVAGRRGLLRVRDGKVRKLDARLYPWTARLSGVVQTPRGETWLRVPTGIARVSSAQLDKAFDHPGFPLDLRIFDQRDGLVGTGHVRFSDQNDGRRWRRSNMGRHRTRSCDDRSGQPAQRTSSDKRGDQKCGNAPGPGSRSGIPDTPPARPQFGSPSRRWGWPIRNVSAFSTASKASKPSGPIRASAARPRIPTCRPADIVSR